MSTCLWEARKWRAAGFDANSALGWLKPGTAYHEQPLDLAVRFANLGWHHLWATLMELFMDRLGIEDHQAYLCRWPDLALDPSTTADFIKAGVTPEEAPILAQWRDKEHLKDELRARTAELPPFDKFTALRINTMNDLGDPERKHLQLFNREILWDYHAEENVRDIRRYARQLRLELGIHGETLVAVIEHPYDADDDEEAQSLRRLKDAAIAGAVAAGNHEKGLRIEQRDNAYIAIATDGSAYAAVLRPTPPMPHVNGKPRKPTSDEISVWAEVVTKSGA